AAATLSARLPLSGVPRRMPHAAPGPRKTAIARIITARSSATARRPHPADPTGRARAGIRPSAQAQVQTKTRTILKGPRHA
ncbi:hypothetical protein, partial [Roseicyclus marinus]